MSSLLIGGEDQGELLLEALEMGMVSNGYVFIPYDALLYAMPYQVTNQNTLNPLTQSPGLWFCVLEVVSNCWFFFLSCPIRTQYFLS